MLETAALILVAATAGGIPIIVYVLGALLAGGGLTLAYTVLQNWRRGPMTDASLISDTITNQLGGMKQLLDEYRVELEVAKRQLEDYRAQLYEVTRELAKAQVQISQLERSLDSARDRRDDMEHELDELRRHYEELTRERIKLEGLTRGLSERLAQLGIVVGEDGEEIVPPSRRPLSSGGGAIAP